jgi:NADH dehydrogenase
VRRIVHVSITNPEQRPDLPYFSGKARLERFLKELGISYSILRPAVLFGPEDILINNIAWALRRFPIFAVFGRGDYRLQPIHVEDFAKLAVLEGQCTENRVINAIGPENFTYRSLVQMLGEAIGKPRAVAGVPPRVGYLLGRLVGSWMKDRFITWEEVLGLMADLLYVEAAPPAGEIRLSEWARANRETLGRRYAGEMARRLDRSLDYRAGPVGGFSTVQLHRR